MRSVHLTVARRGVFALVVFAGLVSASTGTGHAAAAGDKRAAEWIDLAREEANAGRHEAALAAADSALREKPGDFEARLLRARVLSWQGRFATADAALAELRRERPDDQGAGLALGYLRYYEGRLGEAAAEFRRLGARDSSDADAREGLKSVERAQAARAAAPAPRPWRVDAGGEYSRFTRRAAPAWNQQFVQLARRLPADAGATAVHGRVERYERYELTDWALEAGAYREFFPRLRGAFVAGFAPDAVFRPRWRVAADAEGLVLPRPAYAPPSIPGLWLSLSGRYDVYEATEFVGVLPGARFEWERGWAFALQLAHAGEVGGTSVTGWSARVDGATGSPRLGALRENARFMVGYADAPETEARGPVAATVSTRTVFGGLALDFDGDWSLNLGYARDDRENSWIRHAFSAGLAYVF